MEKEEIKILKTTGHGLIEIDRERSITLMNEKPILFSAPMVRAILYGNKTQTRRTTGLKEINEAPDMHEFHGLIVNKKTQFLEAMFTDWRTDQAVIATCPYGRVGNVIWVRETIEKANYGAVGYPADGTWLPNTSWVWKRDKLPSIFMPRGLSRIDLLIKNVRVELLQDISEEDARAEGCKEKHLHGGLYSTAYSEFSQLWESIKGAGSWDANPWCWCLTFEVVKNAEEHRLGN